MVFDYIYVYNIQIYIYRYHTLKIMVAYAVDYIILNLYII